MKKITFWTVLAICLAMLASCQKEESVELDSAKLSDNSTLELSTEQMNDFMKKIEELNGKIFKVPVQISEEAMTKGIGDKGSVTIDRRNMIATMTENEIDLTYCKLEIYVVFPYGATPPRFENTIYLMKNPVEVEELYYRKDAPGTKYTNSDPGLVYFLLNDKQCSFIIETTHPTTHYFQRIKISFELQVRWYVGSKECEMELLRPSSQIL